MHSVDSPFFLFCLYSLVLFFHILFPRCILVVLTGGSIDEFDDDDAISGFFLVFFLSYRWLMAYLVFLPLVCLVFV